MHKLTKESTKKVLEIASQCDDCWWWENTRTSVHIDTVPEQNTIMYLLDLFEKNCKKICNTILKFVGYWLQHYNNAV